MIERESVDGLVRATFLLPASGGEVSLVGNFNDWDAEANRLTGDGAVQATTVELAPGSRYEFRYLGTDGRWFDEADADER